MSMQRDTPRAKTGGSEKTKVDTGDSPTYWLKPEDVDDMRMATLENSAHYLAARNDAIIALLYDTGLRNAECVALNASMIDWDDSVIRVPARIQKGYNPDKRGGPRPATIGLKPDTLRTLHSYVNGDWYQRKDTDALFPGRSSDRISTQGIRNLVTKAAKDADIHPYAAEGNGEPSDVHPHTLRHSVFYRMVRREGKQLIEVTNRLRHSTKDTTEAYYSHIDVV